MAIKIKFDIQKLPKGLRIALAVVPASVIIAAAIIFIWMPKNKEIVKLNKEIDAQLAEITKSKDIVAKLDVLKVENEKLTKRLDKLKEQLPEEKEVSSLLKQMSDIAARSDVEIISWKPEAKKTHPSGIVEEIPFSLALKGTYHHLGSFFGNITHLNRIVNFSDIKVTGAQGQRGSADLSITFKASTFSAVKEEEKAAAKGGQPKK